MQITGTEEEQVLQQLARIIDPDFGQDIVTCGFVKGLQVDPQSGQVAFALELTTPACPIKDEFERKARDYVMEIPWVQQASLPSPSQLTHLIGCCMKSMVDSKPRLTACWQLFHMTHSPTSAGSEFCSGSPVLMPGPQGMGVWRFVPGL